MTEIDLSHPTEGAKLDIHLLHLVFRYCVSISMGKHNVLCVQLANRGGALPVLCVEPDDGLYRRKPLVRVRYLHPHEGYELNEPARTLLGYTLALVLGRE
jgi:hypothetical protein